MTTPKPVILALLVILSGLFIVAAPRTVKADSGPGPGGEQVIELAPSGFGRANSLAYSPDGRWLAVGTASGIAIYDAHGLAEESFIPTETWVRSVAFSPDGQHLVTGSYDQLVRLWRVADGVLVRSLAGHEGWVRSVAFSPDGLLVASASDDNSVRLWRVHDGTVVRVLTEGLQGPSAVVFSPDGQLLATGGYDNFVHLWRVADGVHVQKLEGHGGWVRCLAFAPDGLTLASGGFDTTIRLWRVSDGQPLAVLAGHAASVLTTAFSPDGQTLASGSVDGTVRLWRTTDGRAAALLTGHTNFVFAVAFAPDGQTLASGAVDNTVRVWTLDTVGLAPYTERLQAPETPSTCGYCHHPRGTLQSPTTAQPARIVEMECSTCHGEGALVRNWDPEIQRAPGSTTVLVAAPSANDQVGVPHGVPTLNIQISTPGNGEFIYSGGSILALVPVAGRVDLAAGQVTALDIRLEIWSGSHQVETLSTRPLPDGSFTFAVNVNADEPTLQVPIDLRDCQICHDSTYENYPVGDYAQSGLPPGEVRLVVTATTPDGTRAYDERWITVDYGQVASVTVRTTVEGGEQAVVGVPVHASTRLYEWRGRTFTGAAGADGTVHMEVEALAEVPTVYTFEVPPTVIEGRLYTSVAPVSVTVPAGAVALPPVTLEVRALAGQISGRVAPATQPLTVYAVRLPEATRWETRTLADGTFEFSDLPLADYWVVADGPALAAQGLSSSAQRLDLEQTLQAEVTLNTEPVGVGHWHGVVTDNQGARLPFAWVTAGLEGPGTAALPDTGAWALTELAVRPRTLIATAPGYYSQAIAPPDADPQAPVRFALVPRPEMHWLPWGAGQIAVPPETQAAAEGGEIALAAGWLWGAGGGTTPILIDTAGLRIALTQAEFALENVPGQTAWLYLIAGEAEVWRAEAPTEKVALSSGTMLALTPAGRLVPVPLDPLVLQAVRLGADTGVRETWEPSAAAQLQKHVALLGTSVAQVVTFVTYMMVLISLFTVPVGGVGWWLYRKRRGERRH